MGLMCAAKKRLFVINKVIVRTLKNGGSDATIRLEFYENGECLDGKDVHFLDAGAAGIQFHGLRLWCGSSYWHVEVVSEKWESADGTDQWMPGDTIKLWIYKDIVNFPVVHYSKKRFR